MRNSKPRNRSNKNRNTGRSMGNVMNRVFDSSGPEGKVRGTPQQIIEKYTQLARDAQLSGDRVAFENFQQHSEHYSRLQAAAQREQDIRREQQERENAEKQAQRDAERAEKERQRVERVAESGQQEQAAEEDRPVVQDDPMAVVDSVEIPEIDDAPKKPRRRRASPKPKAEVMQDDSFVQSEPVHENGAE